MREKGQQSAKFLTHLVTYRGKKKEKCWFSLYVGRCKGKTDICQFIFLFLYEPFPYRFEPLDFLSPRVPDDRGRIGWGAASGKRPTICESSFAFLDHFV